QTPSSRLAPSRPLRPTLWHAIHRRRPSARSATGPGIGSGCLWSPRQERPQVLLDCFENIRLHQRESLRSDRVGSSSTRVLAENPAHLPSLGADLPGGSMIDVMPQIGSELINVSERCRPVPIESGPDRFAE